ncbi:hypothetical protein Leryth_014276 [Lithospermum erythrorhizon]|nr:hypothetical protein Leryth_014276 [Lithospermum erythrorhizon]
MGKRPHVIAVPFPAQGHVKPLMKLAYKIASHGIKVTFVNTESTHKKLFTTSKDVEEQDNIVFTSVPSGSSRTAESQPGMVNVMKESMPGYFKELIEKITSSEKDEHITCVIADSSMGWILDVAERLGIEQVAFNPASVATLAFISHIPKFIESGIVDYGGQVMVPDKVISITESIPPWEVTGLPWSFLGLVGLEKVFFECCETSQQAIRQVKWRISNTFYEIEPAACDLIPGILPIGPLIEADAPRTSATAGSFMLEDLSCLNWLDKQSSESVVYVSFGSVAVMSKQQINELAFGLEISGQPFLWVVRADLTNEPTPDYPEGFLERVGDKGKIVEWAPQEKVLAHPSVACFLTHCGWNSTLECLSRGVRYLCWPSFADQFHNQSYICDVWKVGLKLEQAENGLMSRDEIKNKIGLLLSDENLIANAVRMKKLATETVSQNGSSFKNFEKFIKFLKD